MAEVEYANALARSPFPEDWGFPEGKPRSRERAVWAARKMTEQLRSRGDHREARPLFADDVRRTTTQLMHRIANAPTRPTDDPGPANVRRQRALLLANRHGPV